MFAHGLRYISDDREHDGYFYTIVNTVGNVRYLCCKEKRLQSCGATANIIDGQFTLKKPHNHPVNQRLIRVHRFNEALFNAVTSSLRDLRVVYDEICAADPDGAAFVPFSTAKQSMLRWRSIIRPQIPRTWANYIETLETEAWLQLTTYSTGRLNVTNVQGGDGSTSIMYGDIDFLRSIQGNRFYLDATFQVCPLQPRALQLLTIMIQIDDCVLPIAWALMERKTTEAYLSVLRHFSTVLAPHLRPSTYMTDYERALASALAVTYPEAVPERCYFHYCQALMKRVKKLRLSQLIEVCNNKQILFRMLMALPLLPAPDIRPAFDWIVRNAIPDVARDFERLFQYFERFWMRNVTPEVFSVFKLESKTNNVAESYHRVLKVRLGVHPSIWQFTAGLLDLQAVVWSSRTSLDLGLPIVRPSQEKVIIQQQILQRAWSLYEEQLLDIPRFLTCATHFLRAFNNGLLLTRVNEVDMFVNADLNVPGANDAQVRQNDAEENAENIILQPQQRGVDDANIMHPELLFEVCGICADNSKDTISLPCNHSFACAACTRVIVNFAIREIADIRCAVCGEHASKAEISGYWLWYASNRTSLTSHSSPEQVTDAYHRRSTVLSSSDSRGDNSSVCVPRFSGQR